MESAKKIMGTTTTGAIGKKTGQNGETTTDCKIRNRSPGSFYQDQFPEEVLENIFFRLNDSDDLFAVSNSCPQFQRILEPSKLVWSFDMVFPLIYSNLDKTDILNCRLVCSRWNKAVDTFLQTHPIIRSLEQYPHQQNDRRTWATAGYKHGPPQYLPTLIQKGFFGNGFVTRRSMATFLNDMKSHTTRNPFVMRYLELANCPAREHAPKLFWSNSEQLLERFGQHVWHVHLRLKNISIYTDNLVYYCYRILLNVLRLLPNLKKLSISGFKGYDLHRTVKVYDYQVVNYIDLHPLPALPNLEMMECAIPVHSRTVPVVDELMTRYGSQVRKLFVWLTEWQKDKPQYTNMPNLQDLQISVNDDHLACVHMIKSLNAPKLTKIYMVFQLDVEILHILEELKNSCTSLSYLGLYFRKKHPDSFVTLALTSPPQFHLEGIKTLELSESQTIPYEFLFSYFPNLEHVLVLCKPKKYEDGDRRNYIEEGEYYLSEIRQLLFSRQMYKSDIWERLNNLKDFTIATLGKGNQDEQIVSKKQFTRDMYEFQRKSSG